MKTKRITIRRRELATREEAEAAMHDLAAAANNKRRLTATMDKRILAIKEAAEPDLAACDALIKERTEELRGWAESHPELFEKKKSLELFAGRLGFRTGTPKLALLGRNFTWESVTQLVCQFLPNFIRSRPEVDKEAILAQRDEEAVKAILPRCGLKVVQQEGFYAEPTLTDAEAV